MRRLLGIGLALLAASQAPAQNTFSLRRQDGNNNTSVGVLDGMTSSFAHPYRVAAGWIKYAPTQTATIGRGRASTRMRAFAEVALLQTQGSKAQATVRSGNHTWARAANLPPTYNLVGELTFIVNNWLYPPSTPVNRGIHFANNPRLRYSGPDGFLTATLLSRLAGRIPSPMVVQGVILVGNTPTVINQVFYDEVIFATQVNAPPVTVRTTLCDAETFSTTSSVSRNGQAWFNFVVAHEHQMVGP